MASYQGTGQFLPSNTPGFPLKGSFPLCNRTPMPAEALWHLNYTVNTRQLARRGTLFFSQLLPREPSRRFSFVASKIQAIFPAKEVEGDQNTSTSA